MWSTEGECPTGGRGRSPGSHDTGYSGVESGVHVTGMGRTGRLCVSLRVPTWSSVHAASVGTRTSLWTSFGWHGVRPRGRSCVGSGVVSVVPVREGLSHEAALHPLVPQKARRGSGGEGRHGDIPRDPAGLGRAAGGPPLFEVVGHPGLDELRRHSLPRVYPLQLDDQGRLLHDQSDRHTVAPRPLLFPRRVRARSRTDRRADCVCKFGS